MYMYRRTVISGDMVEKEYYRSIKKVGKNYGGRSKNRSLSPQKQKTLNNIRAEKNMQRLIMTNYREGDWFARFSAPFGTFITEEEFRRAVENWFSRIRYRCAKKNIKFKYIAFIECGKLGKNWHIHIIIKSKTRAIAQECWNFKDGMNFTPLYQSGNFEKLARYIRKDVSGEKRIMTSRNLDRPVVEVREVKQKEFRRLERGEAVDVPDGYYLLKDDSNYNYNEVTGASWYFCFMPIAKSAFRNLKN